VLLSPFAVTAIYFAFLQALFAVFPFLFGSPAGFVPLLTRVWPFLLRFAVFLAAASTLFLTLLAALIIAPARSAAFPLPVSIFSPLLVSASLTLTNFLSHLSTFPPLLISAVQVALLVFSFPRKPFFHLLFFKVLAISAFLVLLTIQTRRITFLLLSSNSLRRSAFQILVSIFWLRQLSFALPSSFSVFPFSFVHLTQSLISAINL